MVFLGGKARVYLNGKLIGTVEKNTVEFVDESKLLKEEEKVLRKLAGDVGNLLDALPDLSMIQPEEDRYIREVVSRRLLQLHRLSAVHYEYDFSIDYAKRELSISPRAIAPPIGNYVKKNGYWT